MTRVVRPPASMPGAGENPSPVADFSCPPGLVPVKLATRPSQREALAEANGRDTSADHRREIAITVLVAVATLVLLVIAARGCA